MKLQLAIDLLDTKGAIALVEEVRDHVDVIEVGTPVIINEGLGAVKAMKEAFPEKEVLADVKIMDAASYEVAQASAAGADIITILAASEDASIKGAIEEAKKNGKEILVDMIGIQDLAKRAQEVDAMGADYICVHKGYDMQALGKSPFEDLKTIKEVVKNSKTAIAGGIKLDTIEEALAQNPDLLIVGGGIANAENKNEVAKTMHDLVKNHKA